MEGLEARDVPAAFRWTGDYSSDAADWRNWDSVEAPGLLPGPGSNVYFGQNATPDYMTMNRPCVGLEVPGAYHGVYINNKYGQTITLSSGFVTADLIMQASPTGAISQPAAGTDITVTSNFIWTGSTLNSSSHVSAVTLDGANGLIAPRAAGVVSLGSNLSVVNAAVLNLYAGTIDCINDGLTFTVATGGGVAIDPGQGNSVKIENVVASEGVILGSRLDIGTGSWVEVRSGTYDNGGFADNSGRFTVKSNCTAVIPGRRGDSGTPSYVQNKGETQLYGGAKLNTGRSRIEIFGGKLVTRDDGATADATIESLAFDIHGGEVVLCDGAAIHRYATLNVIGDVHWSGGTYRPVVDGTLDDGPADLWKCTGIFRVRGTPVLAPGSLDCDDTTQKAPLASGWTWLVLQGDAGIEKTPGSNGPTVTGYFEPNPVAVPTNIVTQWRIKSKVD